MCTCIHVIYFYYLYINFRIWCLSVGRREHLKGFFTVKFCSVSSLLTVILLLSDDILQSLSLRCLEFQFFFSSSFSPQ